MKYETATSIKGWVALLIVGVGSLYGISVQAPGHKMPERIAVGLILLIGMTIGLGWVRGRKRIRAMQRRARTLRAGLSRAGLWTS